METHLRIGEVARGASVNVQTIRFYERRHLLRPRQRALNGYRYYDEESVRLVRFIKRAQALGFSLREVQALLRLRDTSGVPCEKMGARAEQKIAEITSKERRLAAMRGGAGAACGDLPHDAEPPGMPDPGGARSPQ